MESKSTMTARKDTKESQTSNSSEKEEIAAILGTQGKHRRRSVACEPYDPEKDEGPQEFESFPKTDEERARIREHLTGIFFFRVLDQHDLGRVIEAMEPRVVKTGDVVIKEGDDGDYFYVIDSGHFAAYVAAVPDRPVTEYKGEGYFGELALLHNQPRSATVKALNDGTLWAVSRETFSKLVIKRAFEKRRRYLALLDGVPAVQPLNEYERMQVADALCPSSLAAGEVLFREGDEGDGMYFVEEGLLRVTKISANTGEEELNRVGPEGYVGELALLNNQARMATVTAVEDTKLAFLDRMAFERLLGPCRDILRQRSQSYRRLST